MLSVKDFLLNCQMPTPIDGYSPQPLNNVACFRFLQPQSSIFFSKALLRGSTQGGLCNQVSKFIVEREIGFLLAIVVMTE